MEVLIHLHYPTTIIVVCVLLPIVTLVLWIYLGVAGLFGIVIMIAILIIQLIMSRFFNPLWKESSSLGDTRTTLVNDIV